ncbi:MAG: DNA cytosine methyltransferase [Kiritimatiellae bacterium]|nr:DNA cytosine methyltransferase [Kiritimatiellia bacterium]MDD4736733.1 DNA cytosine methyltransferase [Kiritimatiellia bacterium]
MDNTNNQGLAPSNIRVGAVDLFCGAGGLTRGLENAGINVRLGVDVDPACRYPFSVNNKAEFLEISVTDLDSENLGDAFDDCDVRLLAGCAPCQTFSRYNQKAGPSDDRWWLLQEFSRLVAESEPELVTMENVPGLMDQAVFFEFATGLETLGYHVCYEVVDCSEYGMPQQRNRLVLLASKFGPIKLLRPKDLKWRKRTVRQAIGKLPALSAGEVDAKDPLHQCADLSELNLRRIQVSKPGGSWKDWDEKLVAKCHRKKSGKTYPSVYGRMKWDEPAPTMTTQFYGFGNGRFGHPEQDRAMSLREGAILQSFPKSYKFIAPGEPIYRKTLGRMIGNAVPVRLGELIGRSINSHLSAYGENTDQGLSRIAANKHSFLAKKSRSSRRLKKD